MTSFNFISCHASPLDICYALAHQMCTSFSWYFRGFFTFPTLDQVPFCLLAFCAYLFYNPVTVCHNAFLINSLSCTDLLKAGLHLKIFFPIVSTAVTQLLNGMLQNKYIAVDVVGAGLKYAKYYNFLAGLFDKCIVCVLKHETWLYIILESCGLSLLGKLGAIFLGEPIVHILHHCHAYYFIVNN